MDGIPTRAILAAADRSNSFGLIPWHSSSLSIRFSRFIKTTKEITAHIPCAINVAHATPATPISNRITNKRSNPIFVSADTIKKRSGVLLSPNAL